MAVNSSSDSSDISLDGLEQQEAKQRMLDWLQHKGCGRERVNYKLRDWLFARQRYWGEPFPIIFPEGTQVSPRLPFGRHSSACVAHLFLLASASAKWQSPLGLSRWGLCSKA